MPLLVPALLFATVAASTTPRPLNASEWVTITDYPSEALTRHQEGTVAIRLDIDRTGRVSGCAVTSSSGAPALDATTCGLLFICARFEPARDPTGASATGTFTTRLTWRNPVDGEAAPKPVALTGTMIQYASGSSVLHVDSDGVITACESNEAPYANVLRPPDICGLFRPGARFSPPTTRNGKPVRRRVVIGLSVSSTTIR